MQKILIVDDCQETLFVLRLILEDSGHRVHCLATREQEAVRAAIDFAPDLALLDLQMPGVGVREFIDALRGSNPVRIALATGDVVAGRPIAKELDLPLLEKPFTADQLLDALNIGQCVAS